MGLALFSLNAELPNRGALATVNARRMLSWGFTSIRDLETEGAGYADVDVKNAIERGIIPGPRMQVATRSMDVTGAYPLLGYAPGTFYKHFEDKLALARAVVAGVNSDVEAMITERSPCGFRRRARVWATP